ncbi:MAG: N-acetylneuraminate synthase [Oscillospiraceae bacterium]|jgi:N,N'-diacetyllegionaminate synthase|nr:N-acetylneuraminate synthase [Oscillospiraceae bacterium]
MGKIFIIAEAGVNHNGNLYLAKKLIDIAKIAGADAVKFQTFKTENEVSKTAQKADYQKQTTKSEESQFDMIKKLEFSYSQFLELANYCKKKDIIFLSTAFDLESVNFLSKIDLPLWKIPSGEITNLPYLIEVAKQNKPIALSTGMCEISDIEEAFKVIRKYNKCQITLLHCNTEYPTPMEDVNLRAMVALGENFSCPIGYSDHTLGISVPIAAVALGASMIEKHFTCNKTMEGPDHIASLEPGDLEEMVHSIRDIEKALGSKHKKISKSEQKNIAVARKSIVATKAIEKGEIFNESNIGAKRPGTGLSPMRWFEILGKVAKRNFDEDELIEI